MEDRINPYYPGSSSTHPQGSYYPTNAMPFNTYQVNNIKIEPMNDPKPEQLDYRCEEPSNQDWMVKYASAKAAGVAPQSAVNPLSMNYSPYEGKVPDATSSTSSKVDFDFTEENLNSLQSVLFPPPSHLSSRSPGLEEATPPSKAAQASPETAKEKQSEVVIQQPPERRFYHCSKCEYKTPFPSNLQSHELNHSGTFKYHCSKCEYKTNFKSNFKNHELNHSGIYKFQCSKCEYKTNFKNCIKNHELIHSDTKLFHCTQCEYQTNFKSCLKSHEMQHSGTYKFQCPRCDYKTNFKSKLKNHDLTHSDKRLFECGKCDFKTNFKVSLQTHESMHAEAKPFHIHDFQCSECDYKTHCKRNLKYHEMQHTGMYKYQCSKSTLHKGEKDESTKKSD